MGRRERSGASEGLIRRRGVICDTNPTPSPGACSALGCSLASVGLVTLISPPRESASHAAQPSTVSTRMASARDALGKDQKGR